jgi:hypothetical protein
MKIRAALGMDGLHPSIQYPSDIIKNRKSNGLHGKRGDGNFFTMVSMWMEEEAANGNNF